MRRRWRAARGHRGSAKLELDASSSLGLAATRLFGSSGDVVQGTAIKAEGMRVFLVGSATGPLSGLVQSGTEDMALLVISQQFF